MGFNVARRLRANGLSLSSGAEGLAGSSQDAEIPGGAGPAVAMVSVAIDSVSGRPACERRIAH